jgi:Protein of unknown function (DUF2490)
LFILILICCFRSPGFAIEPETEQAKTFKNTSGFWLGIYTKYRLSKRVFYYGEYHIRRRNNLFDNMAQIYLRFGATYLVNSKMSLTGGIATPLYWAPNQDAENIDKVVPQFRFWEQLLLVQHIGRTKLYHQYRIEQRWEREYEKGSPFRFDFRSRYKIAWYYPLNNRHFVPKTFFLSPYAEIFFQAGKRVKYNYFEDFRLFLGAGYILNKNFQFQAGYMFTFRHAGSPYDYEKRHIIRISVFHSFDFYNRKQELKRQEAAILRDEF